MKQIYYSKLYSLNKDDLNNKNNFQLFNLINSIIIAFKQKKSIIIVNNFLNDGKDSLYSNISDIINLPKFNTYLQANYNLSIVDKENLNFKIHSILYGHYNNNIDLLTEITSQFYQPNKLYIDTNVNLNFLKNYDPIPNNGKHVYIHYSINDLHIKEVFDELGCYLKEPISFNLDDSNFNCDTINLTNIVDKNMFDDILQNLFYYDIYDIITNNYLETNQLLNKKNNIIDFQLNSNTNKNLIVNKYISLIEKYMNKSDNIIILPSYMNTQSDKLFKYLSDNGYKYFIRNYLPVLGDEINTIIDINLGKKCNNVFIGNFNINECKGSNLTYTLLQQMDTNVKHILIDINNINNPENINFFL